MRVAESKREADAALPHLRPSLREADAALPEGFGPGFGPGFGRLVGVPVVACVSRSEEAFFRLRIKFYFFYTRLAVATIHPTPALMPISNTVPKNIITGIVVAKKPPLSDQLLPQMWADQARGSILASSASTSALSRMSVWKLLTG